MNKNIWDLFKHSEKGKNAISLFSFDSEEDDFETKAEEIFKKFSEYLGGLGRCRNFINRCYLILDNIYYQEIFIEKDETNSRHFERLIDTLELNMLEVNDDDKLIKITDFPPFVKQKDYKTFRI